MSRLRIGIIGAGRMGCALAIGLKKKRYCITGIYSKHTESFEFLRNKLQSFVENDLLLTVENSDVIFITVPDTEIYNVAQDIASRIGHLDMHDKVFLHCSGALTSDVLEHISQLGGHTGSLHPIQTFADKQNGWSGLDNIYFGFEGCSEAGEVAQGIVKAFNGCVLDIKKQDKQIYHAAACILSNYVVTLSYIAGDLFNKIGIDSNIGVKALIPLIEKTVNNIKWMGSIGALTGPISRGDYGVVEGHINSISEKDATLTEIYKILGRATVDIALEKQSIRVEDAERLKKIL